MKTYVRWHWFHDVPEEPCLFYAELDEERWVMRTVEVYADGRQCYAQEGEECGTFMPEAAYPSNEVINEMGEYRIQDIKKEEFEAVWENRKSHVSERA